MDFRNWLSISETISSAGIVDFDDPQVSSYTDIGHDSYYPAHERDPERYPKKEIHDILWVHMHDTIVTRKVSDYHYGHLDWFAANDATNRNEVEAQGRIDLKTKEGSVYWLFNQNQADKQYNEILDRLFKKFPNIQFYEFSPSMGKGKPIPKRLS